MTLKTPTHSVVFTPGGGGGGSCGTKLHLGLNYGATLHAVPLNVHFPLNCMSHTVGMLVEVRNIAVK